jgi:hypothetical protein
VTEHNALTFLRGLVVQARGWALDPESNRGFATAVHEATGLAVELRRGEQGGWTCDAGPTGQAGAMSTASRLTPWPAVLVAVERAHTAQVEARMSDRTTPERRAVAQAQAAALGALLSVALAAKPEPRS